MQLHALTSAFLLAGAPAHSLGTSSPRAELIAASVTGGTDVLGDANGASDGSAGPQTTTSETSPAAPSAPADPPLASGAAPQSARNGTTSSATSDATSSSKGTVPAADQGVIVVTAPARHGPGDPFEGVNIQSYAAVQVFDKALVAPAAKVYKEVVPSPLRKGLHNFLSNLGEPVIAMNFLLQLHPGRALKTIGRFGLNTTIGIGGVLDVAKTRTFKLPFHPNGFADTLGYYGVKPGPYFYLPFLGATTLRDVVGYTIDGFGLPTLIGKPFNKLYYTIPANTIRSLDYRVRYDNQLREIRETKNPYVTARITYLQQRRDEIEALHSHPARQRDTVQQPSSAPTTTAPVAPPIPAPSATTPPPAGDTPPATPPKE